MAESLVVQIEQGAKAMNLSVEAHLMYLEQCRQHRLDPRAQDAARFVLSKHSESLRKLAE